MCFVYICFRAELFKAGLDNPGLVRDLNSDLAAAGVKNKGGPSPRSSTVDEGSVTGAVFSRPG